MKKLVLNVKSLSLYKNLKLEGIVEIIPSYTSILSLLIFLNMILIL